MRLLKSGGGRGSCSVFLSGPSELPLSEFQLDRGHHKVKKVVYANKKIQVLDDPYGAASCRLTKSDLRSGLGA